MLGLGHVGPTVHWMVYLALSHGQALCPGLHWTPLKQGLTWEHPSAIIPSLQYDFYILGDNNIRVSLLKWSRGSHLYFHYSWIKELQVELRAEIWALFYTSASDLKFGSSGRSTWTSYTLFDALGLLILIISALDQFRDVVSWNGTSRKTDCWNWSCSLVVPVSARKTFIACKYCKSTIFNYRCRKPAHFTLLCHLLTT